ncbi:DUF2711 family protein [Bacillus sp. APMAM]|nr:DUF2711 family protein [Bacillus sp. APMAM]RTZ53315.1 DUF2711 family protein [Bacillus sp. SAJ1]
MINARKLPAPHKYAVCANEDIPIKEFYKGVYQEIFIFYHPFIKPKTIDYALFNPDTFPSKNEILKNCEMVSWGDFLKISGIKNLKQLDIGLRTLIMGLNKKFANEYVAEVIQRTCEENQIVPPVEGTFPEFLMNKILYNIKKIGYEWIWCGDEFCTERKLEYIDDLIESEHIFCNQPINLFTHDNKILITTHWDSHFSLICSDKETVGKIVDLCQLEGFYCDEYTKIYWSLFN